MDVSPGPGPRPGRAGHRRAARRHQPGVSKQYLRQPRRIGASWHLRPLCTRRETLVNAGMGSAPSDGFVATELRTIEGPGGTPVLDKLADQVAERCQSDAATWSQLQDALNSLTRSAAEKSLAAKQSLSLYVTWWSLTRKVGIDCHMDLTRRETRRGIGIVPNLERAAPQEMQEYGTELKAEKILAYSISESELSR